MDTESYVKIDKEKRQHVLVTGGSGYLGATLIPMLLEEGYGVTSYGIFKSGIFPLLPVADHPKFKLLKGSVEDKEKLALAMADVDAIVHLAAIAAYSAAVADPELTTRINKEGTENIVQLLKPQQQLVYSSTYSSYGAVEGVCTEETPISPLTVYGKSKAAGEKAVLAVGGVSLRLATLFGISPRLRLDLLVNDLTRQALKEHHISLYQGSFKRTFLHVKDAARACIFALENYQVMSGSAYNIGDETMNMTKSALAMHIQKIVPECVIKFTEEGEDKDKRNFDVSYAKIRKLGYHTTINIENGIRDLVKVLPCLSQMEISAYSNV